MIKMNEELFSENTKETR